MQPVVLNVNQANQGQCNEHDDYRKDLFHLEQFTANLGPLFLGYRLAQK